jgi:hypothetical protein
MQDALSGSPEPIPGRCAAKIPKSDPPRWCKRYPSRGRKRCRKHGGATPTGPASPHWKHGHRSQYAKVLPSGPMLAGYKAAIAASELRTLREQIALAAGLEGELVARVAASSAGFAEWRRARDLATAAEKALREKGKEAAAGELLTQLFEILKAGASQVDAAADLAETLDLERRLRDTESKMTFRLMGAVSVEQLLVMMRQTADVALRFIRAEDDRRQYAHEMRALASGKPGTRLAVVR